MTRLRPVLLLLLAALAAGCIPSRFVRFEAREVRAVKVTAVREEGVDLVLTAEVANPNPLAARITFMRYRIFVGGRRVGEGERGGAFSVAARGSVVVDLPVRVRFADLPPDLPSLVSGARIPYRAQVAVDATSRLGRHHFELDRAGTVRLAGTMKLTLAGDFALKVVQPRGVRLRPVADGMVVVADVEVRNVFPFPLEVRRVDYAVTLGGAPLGAGSHATPITLAPRAATRVALELRIDLAAVPAVLQAVGRGGAEARVRGRAAITPIGGVAEVPFDVRLDPAMLKR